jgi:hypothetical protein
MPAAPGLFSTTIGWPRPLAHLLPDQPRHEVDAAAGRKADDQLDRMCRIILRARRKSAKRDQKRRQHARRTGTHDPLPRRRPRPARANGRRAGITPA